MGRIVCLRLMMATLCAVSSLGVSAQLAGANPKVRISNAQASRPSSAQLSGQPATAKAEACEKTTDAADGVALLQAAQQGDVTEVQALLDCGYDPNMLALWREDFASEALDESEDDTFGELLATPLHAAAWQGHTDVVTLLIEAGADVNKLDEWDLSALMTAVEQGHVALVQQLIEAGADVNYVASCVDCIDETALTLAASRGYAEVASVLLDAGADLDHQDRLGRTALDAALEEGHAEVVEVLQR